MVKRAIDGIFLRRHSRHRRTECALRIVKGEQLGLSHGWRHGVAHLAPKRITFRRGLWQTRLPNPFARAVDIDIESIASDGRQADGSREMWSINPGLVILSVGTRDAHLEWGVPSTELGWVLEAVA